ncbi:hypothetical protein R3P38DRAFT_3236550 [Favolaschia claudopus]|uniref:Uncharacterized protein n=1 Tax=Favolaschia claudopus TaxID=2862362 RepID=A0AAV9ZCF3_9AGAR
MSPPATAGSIGLKEFSREDMDRLFKIDCDPNVEGRLRAAFRNQVHQLAAIVAEADEEDQENNEIWENTSFIDSEYYGTGPDSPWIKISVVGNEGVFVQQDNGELLSTHPWLAAEYTLKVGDWVLVGGRIRRTDDRAGFRTRKFVFVGEKIRVLKLSDKEGTITDSESDTLSGKSAAEEQDVLRPLGAAVQSRKRRADDVDGDEGGEEPGRDGESGRRKPMLKRARTVRETSVGEGSSSGGHINEIDARGSKGDGAKRTAEAADLIDERDAAGGNIVSARQEGSAKRARTTL